MSNRPTEATAPNGAVITVRNDAVHDYRTWTVRTTLDDKTTSSHHYDEGSARNEANRQFRANR